MFVHDHGRLVEIPVKEPCDQRTALLLEGLDRLHEGIGRNALHIDESKSLNRQYWPI